MNEYQRSSSLQHIADRIPPTRSHALTASASRLNIASPRPSANSSTAPSTPPTIIAPPSLENPNSSGTLYVDQTITTLKKRSMLRCLARAVYDRLQRTSTATGTEVSRRESIKEVLDAVEVSATHLDGDPDATDEDIFTYLRGIFSQLVLEEALAVVTLVYLDRIELKYGLSITTRNWKWLLTGCVLTAVKIWDDVAFWLADWPGVDLPTLNAIERAVLALLHYDVSSSPREYAEAYFYLRDYETGPRVQLDKSKAAELGLSTSPPRDPRRRSLSADSRGNVRKSRNVAIP